MEQNIFQNTLSLIEENFPNRRDPMILLMVCKPDDDRIKLCARQGDGYTDCLYLSVYTNKKVAEILVEVKKELSAIRRDQASIDQWDAVALWIDTDGEMQVTFDDDEILDHWNRPELLFPGL